MLNRLQYGLRRFIDGVGVIIAVLMLLMLANVFIDVVMRYLFNDVSIGMQEMEWHLFATMFLFGIGYSLKENAHVRVDMIYERLGEKAQAMINILGTLVFLVPFSLLVIHYGLDFSREAYELGETSGDPGGLPHRWLIKAAIPGSFAFTLLCGLYVILEQLQLLRGKHISHHNPPAA